MIIINGAGSKLAQNYIEENQNIEILAISRSSKFKYKNVKSVNSNSNSELLNILKTVDQDNLVWIKFQTIKFNELITNTSIDNLKESFEVNFFRNFLAVQILIPKMIKSQYGKFIFVDSEKLKKEM